VRKTVYVCDVCGKETPPIDPRLPVFNGWYRVDVSVQTEVRPSLSVTGDACSGACAGALLAKAVLR
jgi:hypothetical protein